MRTDIVLGLGLGSIWIEAGYDLDEPDEEIIAIFDHSAQAQP